MLNYAKPTWLTVPPSLAVILGASPSGSEPAQSVSGINCSIALVQPLRLSQVFLVALSWDSYELAQSNPSLLEDWFCSDEHILRQSTTYSFIHELQTLRYRLIMVEPVLQGYASAGHTKFLVSMQDDNSHDSSSSQASECGIDSDKEGIEIDESFLAGSVLRSISSHSPAVSPRAITREDPMRGEAFGHDSSLTALAELSFCCKPWHEPVVSHTEDHTVYVRTSDLGRVGLLNGDWVGDSRKTLHKLSLTIS